MWLYMCKRPSKCTNHKSTIVLKTNPLLMQESLPEASLFPLDYLATLHLPRYFDCY